MNACVKYKTFCQAISELAQFEKTKGTDRFVKDIIDRGNVLTGHLVINHHPVLGGGDPNNKSIEGTEFTSPRLPFFVDMEYVEVGYALQKQSINPALMYMAWCGIVKPLGRSIEKRPQKSPVDDYLNSRPNLIGIRIGRLIANEYKDIEDFAKKFCAVECQGSNATFEIVKKYGEIK